MACNTSISLEDYFQKFVDNEVSMGRFQNASEVVRAGLRLLEDEENRVIALKGAIEKGTESRLATNFDAKKHLEKLKATKRKNGKLYPHQ